MTYLRVDDQDSIVMIATKTWKFYYYQAVERHFGETRIYLNSTSEGNELEDIFEENGIRIRERWYSKYETDKIPCTPRTSITQPIMLPIRFLNELVIMNDIIPWERLLRKKNYLRLITHESGCLIIK